MKLEDKYLFPTSSSDANFYIYELPEGLGMRQMLAYGTRRQKNPQIKEDIFWIFADIHGALWVQSPTCIHARKTSSVVSLTPKSSILLMNFMAVGNYFLKTTNFRCWLKRDNKTSVSTLNSS